MPRMNADAQSSRVFLKILREISIIEIEIFVSFNVIILSSLNKYSFKKKYGEDEFNIFPMSTCLSWQRKGSVSPTGSLISHPV